VDLGKMFHFLLSYVF